MALIAQTGSAATSRLARKGPLSVDEAEFLARFAERPAKPLRDLKGPGSVLKPSLSRFRPRQPQRSPDRRASRERRRVLGGSSALPDDLRRHYTEGQRSVLCVVAGEIRKRGVCDLPLGKIAALSGVCRTTVQTTLHEARRLGHIEVTERPQRGCKSLTNLVRILSEAWLAWISRRPAGGIGSNPLKMVSPTKKGDDRAHEVSGHAVAFAGELAAIAGYKVGQEPEAWRPANSAPTVQKLLELVQGRAAHLTAPPLDVLRAMTVEIVQRRAAVGDPPRSPRYFEAAVRRAVSEAEGVLRRGRPRNAGQAVAA
jgi:hypothetical protein